MLAVINKVGEVFDALAGLPPGDWEKAIGLAVTAGVTLGVIHVVDAPTFITNLTVIVTSILAVGLAVERIVKATKG